MPGYPEGLWSGALGLPHPPIVLGQTTDGIACRGVLQGGF